MSDTAISLSGKFIRGPKSEIEQSVCFDNLKCRGKPVSWKMLHRIIKTGIANAEDGNTSSLTLTFHPPSSRPVKLTDSHKSTT